jgi:hypothetical protein
MASRLLRYPTKIDRCGCRPHSAASARSTPKPPVPATASNPQNSLQLKHKIKSDPLALDLSHHCRPLGTEEAMRPDRIPHIATSQELGILWAGLDQLSFPSPNILLGGLFATPPAIQCYIREWHSQPTQLTGATPSKRVSGDRLREAEKKGQLLGSVE